MWNVSLANWDSDKVSYNGLCSCCSLNNLFNWVYLSFFIEWNSWNWLQNLTPKRLVLSFFSFCDLNFKPWQCGTCSRALFIHVLLLCSKFPSSVVMDHHKFQIFSLFIEFENCCYFCVSFASFIPFFLFSLFSLCLRHCDCVFSLVSYLILLV